MSNLDLSSQVLASIVTYGAGVVGLVVMLAALGLPIPSTFFVVACGAFIQQGVLEPFSTLGVALGCVVFGDAISYGMGYFLGHRLPKRFTESPAWNRAEGYFHRRGGIAVFLTRCLLTPLAIPVNLIAGSSSYSTWRFVGLAVLGEFTWLLGYGAVGYAFGSQWEAVTAFISNFSGLLAGLALLSLGVYWLFFRSKPVAATLPIDTPLALATNPLGDSPASDTLQSLQN